MPLAARCGCGFSGHFSGWSASRYAEGLQKGGRTERANCRLWIRPRIGFWSVLHAAITLPTAISSAAELVLPAKCLSGFLLCTAWALALFAIAVFLYCSYQAVLSTSVALSVVGLILAAPLALIARLHFYLECLPSSSPPSALPDVQFVMGYVNRAAVRPGFIRLPPLPETNPANP